MRHVLRINKGDEVVATITNFCENNGIKNASIMAIGAVSETTLGYLKGQEYIKKTFVEEHELISLLGNVTLVDNKPFLHAHVSISDETFATYSGHLFSSTVSATCEVFIDEINLDKPIERVFDEVTNLKIWNI